MSCKSTSVTLYKQILEMHEKISTNTLPLCNKLDGTVSFAEHLITASEYSERLPWQYKRGYAGTINYLLKW